MNNTNQNNKKEEVVAAVFAALVKHGNIDCKNKKQTFVKKESEWKRKRASGLR